MASQNVYERFDAQMTAALEEECPIGHTAIIQRISELAEFLPQFPAIQRINPAQHIRWAEKALKTELTISLLNRRQKPGPDVQNQAEQEDFNRAWKQCLWHLRRASGFGGSEIGTIVLNVSRGETGEFGSAHNTVKEKLLMMAPQIGEPAMRRGNHMEDYVRDIHHKSSGEVEDTNSLAALRGFRSPNYPYIIGTPDDITLRVTGRRKERVLVDYKCPGQAVLEKYKVSGAPFGYKAQLHHYLIVAEDAGIKMNALQLVAFDYHGGAVTYVMPVKHDPALQDEIKVTAKSLWEDYVMEGVIPESMSAPQLKVESVELGIMMRKAGVMAAIAAQMQARADELRNEAIAMADESVEKNAIGKIDAGFYSITRSAEWDEEVLRELAAKADVNPDDYQRPSKGKVNQKNASRVMSEIKELIASGQPGVAKDVVKLVHEGVEQILIMETDLDTLAKDLHEKGVDVSYAYVVKEKASMTMKKNGPEAELKSIVVGNAANLMNEIAGLVDTRIEDFIGDVGPGNDDIPDEGISF